MTPQLLLVLGLLGVCIALFLANRPRMDVVALIAMLALPLSGVVSMSEAFAGFSDPNVILIAALFIVGEGLVRTGIANRLGDFLLRQAGGSETKLLVLLMLVVSLLGSVMSSTGVVAIFIPVVLFVAESKGVPPGRLMMPLSFAGLISGMLSLVGTAPNLVADSALQHAGYKGFSFFSFTPFGAAILVAGILYMLVARRWLTGKKDEGTPRTDRRRLMDYVSDYDLDARALRVRVGIGSPLIGKTLRELSTRRQKDANIVAIERIRSNRRELIEPRADTQIHPGDVLMIDLGGPVPVERAVDLEEMKLEPLPLRGRYFMDQSGDLGMAEVLLPPDSDLVGHSVIAAEFRSKYRLNVIGLRRGREAMTEEILQEKLRTGDTLLVIGRWKNVRDLQTQGRDFIVLNLPVEMDRVAPASSQAPWALAGLVMMMALMIGGVVPNALAALLACLFMGITRCLTLDAAYRSIQWPSLILIIGMMPFSTALQKTGGVDMAVGALLRAFGDAGPHVLLGSLFAFTAVIGMFISNTATAVLMAPIALSAAQAMDASPYPFVMTVALAASSAFMTPVSSPVNSLVMVPGGYRFADFVKVGVPFTLVAMLITVILVPWLLPLT